MTLTPTWSPGGNWQTNVYPHPLLECIGELRYLDDWKFTLEHLDRGQGSVGLTLVVELTRVKNSYRKPPDHPRHEIMVHHLFITPAASYDKRTWRRWLLDRILDVHLHEACENFDVECPECEGQGIMYSRIGLAESTCLTCDGEGFVKPFNPNHEDGTDPYTIREVL